MDDLDLAVDDVSRAMSLTFEKCPGDVLHLALPEAERGLATWKSWSLLGKSSNHQPGIFQPCCECLQKTDEKDPPFLMENPLYLWGEIHYFDWAIFNSYVCLPEVNAQGDCMANFSALRRCWWVRMGPTWPTCFLLQTA